VWQALHSKIILFIRRATDAVKNRHLYGLLKLTTIYTVCNKTVSIKIPFTRVNPYMVNIFIVQWMKMCQGMCFNCVDEVERVSKKRVDIAVRKPKATFIAIISSFMINLYKDGVHVHIRLLQYSNK